MGSTAARSIEITLGEFSFVAHKFNLGETEEIADLEAAQVGGGSRENLIYLRKVIAVAARRDRPELTDDDFRAIEATPTELANAVTTIMQFNGYGKPAP